MSRRKILFTCVLVLSALLVVYDMLIRYSRITNPAGIFIPVLLMMAAWCFVGGWIGWNIVQVLGERMSRLYWPKETVVPPPLYFLTESYEQQGRIGEALQEYQKILRYHPQELQAYVGQLRCQAALGLPPSRLWKLYDRSFRMLESDVEKQILTREYEKLADAMKAIPADQRSIGP
jgi:tetratricopeptide (TPR) repeat protein